MNVNPSGSYNNYKHICTEQQSPEICEAKADRIEGRDR